MAARRKKAARKKTTRKKPAPRRRKAVVRKAPKRAPRKKAAARKTKKKAAGKKTAGRKAPRKKAARKTTRRKRSTPWALALAGNWNRGAFLVGALDELRRAGRLHDPPLIAGSGSGALVGALVALNRWSELTGLFSDLHARELVRPRYPWLPGGEAASFFLSTVTRTPSLNLAEGLRRIVHRHVDPVALQKASAEVHFVVVDLQTGAIRSFSNREDSPDDLMAGLLAACSRPVLMPPVRAGYALHQYAEGTLRGFAPLTILFQRLAQTGAPSIEKVLAVSTAGPAPAHGALSYRDVGSVLRRAADLVADTRATDDVERARLINALLALRAKLGPKRFATALEGTDPATRAEVERHAAKRALPILYLHPRSSPGAGALDLDPLASRAALAAGRAAVAGFLG